MGSSYHVWSGEFAIAQTSLPAYPLDPAVDDHNLPSADPTKETKVQPFTAPKIVSDFEFEETPHHRQSGSAMAKKRHFAHHGPAALTSELQDPVHARFAQNIPDFPCNLTEHCHFSPPCDKPDCDESTKCFDHNAHDLLPCNSDLSWCQDHFECDDVFPCEGDVCNFDFADCNLFPCTDTCHEAECHEPQHAKDCNSACATVACSDPQCDEGVLYCCLSDICPHKVQDCHKPCVQDCQLPHTHCHAPLPQPCQQPCNVDQFSSCSLVSQDSMSASTISTPHTDLSETLPTPTNLHFQSLVEAAATQAFLNASSGHGWGMSPTDDGFPSQRKRRKIDMKSNEQAMYEAKVMEQTFAKPDGGLADTWQDYGYHFAGDLLLTGPSTLSTASSQHHARPQSVAISYHVESVPPEGLTCRWHDEITGICNTTFTSCEDFHNHVKEHTSTLVGNRGSNRDYKCRWLGCDKTDPFGTKNHLDRHMQNHTGFKPFACNICGHRCVTHQQLTNHMTTHTRSKPFVCDFPGCTKSFSVKTALSTHKRTHTNDKPFGCRFCGDKYADSSNLSKHRKTVHEDERTSIPCPEAGCTYRDSRCQRLERHCREKAHGTALYADPMKWAEYTSKWKRKPSASVVGNNRSRAASVAGSSSIGVSVG